MTVYYNAIRRLKRSLEASGIDGLVKSTPHGQMVDTSLFDCDYYEWLDCNSTKENSFEGEFLSEYTWAEFMLGSVSRREQP